jgi:NAD(P)H-dependent FMN reductase
MSKIASFSGSNSSDSINKKLSSYANILAKSHEIISLELEDFDAPIYSLDLEAKSGVPKNIKNLRQILLSVDGYLISCPEHNGSMPAFFKNIMDWISRCDDGSIFNDKPVMIMTASPGGRAGAGVIGHLSSIIPHLGAKSVHTFGLGKFHQSFDIKNTKITDSEKDKELKDKLNSFLGLL